MKLKLYKDANEFFTYCGEFLHEDESFYNFKLGVCANVMNGKSETLDPFFVGFTQQKRIIQCAVRSRHDQPMMISKLNDEAIWLLCEHLIKENIYIKGVVGEFKTVQRFSEQWCEHKKVKPKMLLHLGLYETQKVSVPAATGSMIVAGQNEKDVLVEFLKGFFRDCFPDRPLDIEAIYKQADRQITNQTIYMLKDDGGEILAMAANSRATTNSGAISLVYTPAEKRKQGYATLITALVSQEILKAKRSATLFTDLSNSTSNSIYQKIGFKKIGENVHYEFV